MNNITKAYCGSINTETGEIFDGNPDGSIPSYEDLQNKRSWWRKLLGIKSKKKYTKVYNEPEFLCFLDTSQNIYENPLFGESKIHKIKKKIPCYIEKSLYSSGCKVFAINPDTDNRIYLDTKAFKNGNVVPILK